MPNLKQIELVEMGLSEPINSDPRTLIKERILTEITASHLFSSMSIIGGLNIA